MKILRLLEELLVPRRFRIALVKEVDRRRLSRPDEFIVESIQPVHHLVDPFLIPMDSQNEGAIYGRLSDHDG